ncbi:MAG: DUF885 family protein [Chromatiaceae bacterium]
MPEAAAEFDALSQEFFGPWFRYHPDRAVELGIDGFERLLPAQSDDELGALLAWLESLVVALEEIDYPALDGARRIDLRLMFGAARVEHQELLERDWRHRDPLRFLPIGEIFRLTLRPPEEVREALVSLLRRVPEYLRLAITHLRPMAELTSPALAEAAVDEAERGRCYLRELAGSAWLRSHCHGCAEIERLVDDACTALTGYAEALRREIAPRAHQPLGCGERHLQLIFMHRHFMELDPVRSGALLENALAQSEEELAALCDDTGIARVAAAAHCEANAVPAAARVETCRRESDRLADFLRHSRLVSLPDASLRISERLPCPRPQRFAGEYVPDQEGGSGVLFLAGGLTTEPMVALRARCIDEGWGGTHLLTFAGGAEGKRIARCLCGGTSLRIAWGLYLRERLAALGYMTADDRFHALLHRQHLLRRGLLDLSLNLAAADRTDLSAGAAPATDVVELARRPGDALAGALGWQALVQARQLAERHEGKGFSERAFHDRLLSHGPIPLPLILSEELGIEVWQSISRDLGV